MILLALIVTALFVLFVYYTLVGILRLPIHKKPIRAAPKGNTRSKFFETALLKAAKKLAPKIKLDSFKRVRLARALEVIKSPLTAEEHTAFVVLSSAVIALIGIVALPFNTIIGAAVVIYAYLTFTKSKKKVFRLYHQMRYDIESELPRFVSFIEQKLMNADSSVLDMIEEYKLTDNAAFIGELDRTLADMNTSSYENGLLGLNKRIGSEQLAMVVKGLLGLIRGEDQLVYFTMLKNDMNKLEINELKQNAQGKQKQISKYSGLLFFAIVLILATPLVIVIFDSVTKLFG